ncbi:protein PFC0760c [Monomorium pharaonis]|uniref:protein PFC0760c n=1 Tax=Monomorium pharaonis TaxID=307658 RepID=UPI00063F1D5D|nr:protein PFC0760c [Monomorium pharaonis]
MSPNKRKIFASDSSDEDDSFKHRRSSLKVNLSYCENLTDSGNGSLWRTQIENDKKRTETARSIKGLFRGKSSFEKSRLSDLDTKATSDLNKCTDNNSETSVQIKEGIQLKHLTINLEDIRTKENHLETSCKRLKDAILCKTKQIFDRENELSIKITKVLGNQENGLVSSTHNQNIENKTVMLDMTERHINTSSDQWKDQYCNMVATPTNSDKRKNLEKTVDKSRLTQKRLFVKKDRQVEEQTKCKIIEDVILKKNNPLISPNQSNQSGSPILSCSNRRLSLFRTRTKSCSQNQVENLNNSYSTVHSVQNIGMPVGCSTFIEDAMDEREINNVDMSCATHTTNKVVSMEITEVYGGIRTSDKHISLQNRNSDINNCNENSIEKESKERRMKRNNVTARLENVEDLDPANKVTSPNNRHSYLSWTDDENDEDMENIHVDTVVPKQVSIDQAAIKVTKTHDVWQANECKTKYQKEKRCTKSLSDSHDTIRSSLNVNTSLDEVIETNKMKNLWKPGNHKTNDANQNFHATISNKESSVSNDQRESVNTVRTSLQMNTSVDSIRKMWQRRSDKNDKNRDYLNMDVEHLFTIRNEETNDLDVLENISLIERLRNISVRNRVSHNDKLRVSKMRDEDKRQSINSRDSYSYVEATPYPISRSVLFKSQLKSKTQHLDDGTTCSSNLNSMDHENNDKTKSIALHLKVSNETYGLNNGNGTQKATVDTVILEDISSCNPSITQNQLTVAENISDRTKSEKDGKNMTVQNTEHVSERRRRRKLLPLTETSQLCSISPVEEKKYLSEESTSSKRNKNPKKKLPKRKLCSKNNTSFKNNIKWDTASKQMWSDSDSDISENKKKENKKTRKPKKVVSKKIIIKKYADENMLNILQENKRNKEEHLKVEGRDSFDDFVECRTISTQWNKYKSQKIVIVTTGLSKEDKSLVKSIVKSLGAAELELNVSKRTTHVVSTGVRTVNLLRGIIRGCWLVTLEWILKSLENNTWLDPETFEMKHFSKAVQENRKDRQLFGLSYIPELFTACGFIHVERQTTMPCDTLKELIKTAGGHITDNTKLAKIIIGTNGLKETWVIDSITTGELQLTKLYQRN